MLNKITYLTKIELYLRILFINIYKDKMTELAKLFPKEWVEYIDLFQLNQINLFLDEEKKTI